MSLVLLAVIGTADDKKVSNVKTKKLVSLVGIPEGKP